MNTLLIGLGQAGTTITTLTSEILLTKSPETFINPNSTSVKTFLIDSECKVISSILNTSSSLAPFFSKHTNLITNSSGRGNNWALGHSLNFKEFKTEKNINQDSYEHFVSFIEKCDFINKIMITHSLNGGTGSGCGSRLIEMIREDFPKVSIIECPVFGFEIEKTTLSQFNTFFTIGNNYDYVDLIFKIENEKFKKNFALANKSITKNISDYILGNKHLQFNIEKYYQRLKFVNFGNFEYDYINDYTKLNNTKIDDELFWKDKNSKIICSDLIYKTSSSKNKDYLKLHDKITKHKKCSISSSTYLQDKEMKVNKMYIGSLYKSNNIEWIETMLSSIQKKIEQR